MHCHTPQQSRERRDTRQKWRRCAVGRWAEQVPKERLAKFLEVPNPEGGSNSGGWRRPQTDIRTLSLGSVTNYLNTFSLLNTRFAGPSNRGFLPEAPEGWSTTSAVSSDSIQSMTVANANLAVSSQANWGPYGSPLQHRALPEHLLPERSVNSTPPADVLLSDKQHTCQEQRLIVSLVLTWGGCREAGMGSLVLGVHIL